MTLFYCICKYCTQHLSEVHICHIMETLASPLTTAASSCIAGKISLPPSFVSICRAKNSWGLGYICRDVFRHQAWGSSGLVHHNEVKCSLCSRCDAFSPQMSQPAPNHQYCKTPGKIVSELQTVLPFQPSYGAEKEKFVSEQWSWSYTQPQVQIDLRGEH